ncbi:MAG: hypothetical protein EBT07_14260 [Actinobacteria bacterium]|jgi:hypothetical protein|nr:hypothetical protein [Actinomycetota bacterium]
MVEKLFCFYNGQPYSLYKYEYEDKDIVGLKAYWDNSYHFVPKEKIELVDESDIPTIFIQKCKESMIKQQMGWTTEDSLRMELAVKEKIEKILSEYIGRVPKALAEACNTGKYGIILRFTEYDFDIKEISKPCADGILRFKASEYIEYIIQKYNIDILGRFRAKYDFLEIRYEMTKAVLPNIVVLLPFAPADVMESILR